MTVASLAHEEDIDRAARSNAHVLMTGERGVGKKIVARLVHDRSTRAGAPMATLNCTGVPDSLLESALFGHTRASFTGAYCDKRGLLETAANGTVFLDDVAEVSARLQLVLLRFVETGTIQRVGASGPHAHVNVRLVAGTTRDLPAQIAAGAFREDLYVRLNDVRFAIPPLRERRDDIPSLVKFFLDECDRPHATRTLDVSADAMASLVAYRWPGNVRELKTVVRRISLRAKGSVVELHDLPADVNVQGQRELILQGV